MLPHILKLSFCKKKKVKYSDLFQNKNYFQKKIFLCCKMVNISNYRVALNCKCYAELNFSKGLLLAEKVQCSCYVRPYAATDALYLSLQIALFDTSS